MIKPRRSTIDQNEMYVNAIQVTFFQVFLCLLGNEEVFIPERGWVFCQQFSFEFNNLDVWARLQMSPVLRSRSSVKVHFRRISCLLEVFWIIGRSLPKVNRHCMKTIKYKLEHFSCLLYYEFMLVCLFSFLRNFETNSPWPSTERPISSCFWLLPTQVGWRNK